MKFLSILAAGILVSSATGFSVNFKLNTKTHKHHKSHNNYDDSNISSKSVQWTNADLIQVEGYDGLAHPDDVPATKFANKLSEPADFGSRKSGHQAPILTHSAKKHVPDQYVVVLHEHVDHMELHQMLTQEVHQHESIASGSFRGIHPKPFKVSDGFDSIKGFVAHLGEAALDVLRSRPEIKYIEPDSEVHTLDTEHLAPWGLARISHRHLPSQDMKQDYVYDAHMGNDVFAYVIDTGININHTEFEGRAVWGHTVPEGDADEDGNGHGTHVAGTIAGKKYGVAKGAIPIAVKVLRSNGGGTLSDVIRGIEWAVEDCQSRSSQQESEGKKKSRCVANMSLGGGKSPTLDRAVDAAVGAGVFFAVAAGNDGMDACNYSPAASDRAITVGATSINDRMAWFSNHGKCVDIFAPGHQILSSWIGGKDATNTISGTSMASPHVCGMLALLLSEPKYEALNVKELKDKVISMATTGAISGLPFWTSNKNRLAYSSPPSE